MNLKQKKELTSRALRVGKKRIVFANSRIGEIKEAITKQDIKDLHKDNAIIIKEKKGKKKISRKRKKSQGKIRKKVKKRKKEYVVLTRKLRNYLSRMKREGNLSKREVEEIRKKIRNKSFKSKSHLKEQIGAIKNENT